MADSGARILDAEHTSPAVPWCVVASAIADPEHGDGKLGRVLQHQHKIVLSLPCDGCPAKAIVIGLDKRYEILVAAIRSIVGEVGWLAVRGWKALQVRSLRRIRQQGTPTRRIWLRRLVRGRGQPLGRKRQSAACFHLRHGVMSGGNCLRPTEENVLLVKKGVMVAQRQGFFDGCAHDLTLQPKNRPPAIGCSGAFDDLP